MNGLKRIFQAHLQVARRYGITVLSYYDAVDKPMDYTQSSATSNGWGCHPAPTLYRSMMRPSQCAAFSERQKHEPDPELSGMEWGCEGGQIYSVEAGGRRCYSGILGMDNSHPSVLGHKLIADMLALRHRPVAGAQKRKLPSNRRRQAPFIGQDRTSRTLSHDQVGVLHT